MVSHFVSESKISISDVRLGFNKHYFDLVNKKAHFTSNVDGEIISQGPSFSFIQRFFSWLWK